MTGALLLSLALCGCAGDPAPTPTVEQRLEDSRTPQAPISSPAAFASTSEEQADIALTVNGVPVAKSRLVDLLLESHGVALTEQLIVLEAARRDAAEKGIVVSQADIEREYTRSLDGLLGDVAAGDSEALRKQAAETLLDDMLASRNSSRRAYMIVMERNAILRKIVEPDIALDEEAISLEFDRLYGKRIEIRHIQTASNEDLQQLLHERAMGAEFGVLAMRYSANRATAERLGLLPPFAENDLEIPEPIRREAFLLPPGQDSTPIYVDGWYHVIRVERRIAAEPVSLDAVREAVESSVRERLVDAAMRAAHAAMFQESEIEIHDPKLKELFDERYPNRKPVR